MIPRVIKAGTAAKHYSFADFERQGAELLNRAREQVSDMLAEAERRAAAAAAQVKREAREAGLVEGRRSGHQQALTEARGEALREARAEVQQLAQALATALDQFESQRRGLVARAESGVIQLALAIAGRICRKRFAAPADDGAEHPLRAAARAVLAQTRGIGDCELAFHPADVALLGQTATDLTSRAAGLSHVRLSTDETLARGACVLRTPDGRIDASLDVGLDRIAQILVESAPAQAAPE